MNVGNSKTDFRRFASLCGTLALSVLGPGGAAHAQQTHNLQFAPLNPAFSRSQQSGIAGAMGAGARAANFGFRPSPLNVSHLVGSEVGVSDNTPLPASYDLRTTGKLTPVEDQGQCGSCWTFATMGSLESSLLPGETDSFSENNLKDLSGFDLGYSDGGNRDMSTAYLARWSGAVSTKDDPYNPNSGYSPPGIAPIKHVQEVLYLPDRSGPTDNAVLKKSVMTYGAVMTYIYIDFNAFASNYTYYYSTGSNTTNHAVDIVGWDDNFDKSKFKTPPPGNGAFICRNSWGTGVGQGGYFYVSYYDTSIGRQGGNTVFDNAEPVANYGQVYQYDPLGCIGSTGYGGTDAWFANVFTANASEPLSAVSFYTLAPDTTYTINVYSNASTSPVPTTPPDSTQTGYIATPGYHTIVLSNPATVTAGQKFSVSVKVSGNYPFPIPVEYPMSGYSSKATASAGQSFVSPDGKTWTDLTLKSRNTNVCLKAFTKAGVQSVATPTFSPDGGTYPTAQSVTINCATPGSVIHYTTNGNDPTESDAVPSGSVAVSQSMTLKAKAFKTGSTPSGIKTATYTIAPATTVLSVANASFALGQTATLNATLQTSSKTPLSGKTLSFQINGTPLGTAMTNNNGVAHVSVKLSAPYAPGSYPVSVTFAGDNSYPGTSGSGTLTVTMARTRISATSVKGSPGSSVSLTATLLQVDGGFLSNKTLTFSLHNATVGTAVTNANGVATLAYTIPADARPGSQTYQVTFDSDGTNAASSGSAFCNVVGKHSGGKSK